jgi:membrane protease YdiL (CAAX protease family)
MITPLDDGISFGLWLTALMLAMYLSLFVGLSDALLIPVILLIGGLVVQIAISGKLKHDTFISQREYHSNIIYIGIALGIIVFGSLVIPGLFTPNIPSEIASMSIFDAAMYTSLFAIAEERFFRGGIFTFLTWKLQKPIVAVLACSLIFFIYHFAVYGGSMENLAFVMMGGFALTYVTLKSGRLTPATLAHLLNNIITTLGGF